MKRTIDEVACRLMGTERQVPTARALAPRVVGWLNGLRVITRSTP